MWGSLLGAPPSETCSHEPKANAKDLAASRATEIPFECLEVILDFLERFQLQRTISVLCFEAGLPASKAQSRSAAKSPTSTLETMLERRRCIDLDQAWSPAKSPSDETRPDGDDEGDRDSLQRSQTSAEPCSEPPGGDGTGSMSSRLFAQQGSGRAPAPAELSNEEEGEERACGRRSESPGSLTPIAPLRPKLLPSLHGSDAGALQVPGGSADSPAQRPRPHRRRHQQDQPDQQDQQDQQNQQDQKEGGSDLRTGTYPGSETELAHSRNPFGHAKESLRPEMPSSSNREALLSGPEQQSAPAATSSDSTEEYGFSEDKAEAATPWSDMEEDHSSPTLSLGDAGAEARSVQDSVGVGLGVTEAQASCADVDLGPADVDLGTADSGLGVFVPDLDFGPLGGCAGLGAGGPNHDWSSIGSEAAYQTSASEEQRQQQEKLLRELQEGAEAEAGQHNDQREGPRWQQGGAVGQAPSPSSSEQRFRALINANMSLQPQSTSSDKVVGVSPPASPNSLKGRPRPAYLGFGDISGGSNQANPLLFGSTPSAAASDSQSPFQEHLQQRHQEQHEQPQTQLQLQQQHRRPHHPHPHAHSHHHHHHRHNHHHHHESESPTRMPTPPSLRINLQEVGVGIRMEGSARFDPIDRLESSASFDQSLASGLESPAMRKTASSSTNASGCQTPQGSQSHRPQPGARPVSRKLKPLRSSSIQDQEESLGLALASSLSGFDSEPEADPPTLCLPGLPRVRSHEHCGYGPQMPHKSLLAPPAQPTATAPAAAVSAGGSVSPSLGLARSRSATNFSQRPLPPLESVGSSRSPAEHKRHKWHQYSAAHSNQATEANSSSSNAGDNRDGLNSHRIASHSSGTRRCSNTGSGGDTENCHSGRSGKNDDEHELNLGLSIKGRRPSKQPEGSREEPGLPESGGQSDSDRQELRLGPSDFADVLGGGHGERAGGTTEATPAAATAAAATSQSRPALNFLQRRERPREQAGHVGNMGSPNDEVPGGTQGGKMTTSVPTDFFRRQVSTSPRG